MPAISRSAISAFAVCLALAIVAACSSNSPTTPSSGSSGTGSGTGSAVISGTLTGSQGSTAPASMTGPSGSTPAASSPFAGVTIQVMGTNISTAANATGSFTLSGVSPGTVRLQFTGNGVNATLNVNNVGADQSIIILVQVTGNAAVLVSDSREQKISLCHAEGNGSYHLIDVAVSAEPAHRAHGDAKIGEPVPGQSDKTFDSDCRPAGAAVSIEKFTNGEDADAAPGPSIVVGSPVTWEYRVRNTGTVALTGISVVDNRGVVVTCAGQSVLAPAASMTCSGSGVATLGQYSNIGTVTASWTIGPLSGTVTASDASHYLGVAVIQEEGPKVTLCHKTGNGKYVEITVSVNAEPAHRGHGDGKVGEAVPGLPGKTFASGCDVK
jgi:hypothetical protein